MSVTHPIRTREQPIEKAARLIAQDCVHLVPAALVYVVDGDTDNHLVIANQQGIFCSCEARTPLCSHVLAVAQVRQSEQARVAA